MDQSPIIIGVGEAFDGPPADPVAGHSPIALAAAAAEAAIKDCGCDLRAAIDAIVVTRTFPDSTPFWPHAATLTKNTPRALARRLAIAPRLAVYDRVGGQSPQRLVNEFAARLARGECAAVLIAGGEAIATEKAAQRAGVTLDWSEEGDGEVEDRGLGVEGLLSRTEIENGLVEIGPIYALFEQARRARRHLTREAYAQAMGALFAPFSERAAATPGAVTRGVMSAAEIAGASPANPILYDPFRKAVIAKDGVNMGAAAILTTVATARALGVSEDHWIYLHGAADFDEKPILERPDLGESPAMRAAYETALRRAGIGAGDVRYFDCYSCFPIAVFIAREALGIGDGDPRPLTLTGGLPFFGGPGNNYSLHALAAMTRTLRRENEAIGVVGANGGFLSKHSVGVYSARPPRQPWREESDAALQAELDRAPSARWIAHAEGASSIESYTVVWRSGAPVRAYIVGRTNDGARFLAASARDDEATPASMAADDPLGSRVRVAPAERGNQFSLWRD